VVVGTARKFKGNMVVVVVVDDQEQNNADRVREKLLGGG
jgi:hypothetical protein